MATNITTKFGINTGLQISDTEDPQYGNIKLQSVSYLKQANSIVSDLFTETDSLLAAIPTSSCENDICEASFFYLVEQYNQLNGENRALIASEMGIGWICKDVNDYYLVRDKAYTRVIGEETFTGDSVNFIIFDHQEALKDGPYYVNGTSNSGSTSETSGYFYPLYLSETSAIAVEGATLAHQHTFTEFPGIIFYMPDNHTSHPGDEAAAIASSKNYATAQSYLIITSMIPDDYRLLCSSANSVLCTTREIIPQPINLEQNTVLGRKSDNIQSIDLHELGDLLGSQFIVTAMEDNISPLISSSSHFELTGTNSLIVCKSIQIEPRTSRPTAKLAGSLIFNHNSGYFEGYDGTKWRTLKWGDE